ncbi:MarR family winged helix-turn-helix transcriptional regulator [Aurantimonas coralicida]|uniref:MarR family winged helix-turn-helix transcriptional regulator n=1 Tax=Aurantimonas coralicida TaxID=182270 RepID=UPI00238834E9|nr:MarR family transcriptional regulator [Aurantimonas coralicida]MDE0924922.1 MarR family transcriptional regulator [Aurantimonas coralicida]
MDTASDIDVGAQSNLVKSLLIVAKLSRAHIDLAVRETDLKAGQDELLCVLREDKALTVSVVADLLGIRCSTVSKMVDRLAAKGLVKRCSIPNDFRKTGVHLTPAGALKQIEVREAWQRLERYLCGEMSAEEIEGLHASLVSLDERIKTLRRKKETGEI